MTKFIEKYHSYLLVGIIILAIALRFFKLGEVPPSPNWDEVALGYNAYSILQTGRDEYGALLPVILRSYDDYKPALYSYFIMPLIPIFDLSTFAVRFPSAFFGVLTILATYFLVLELFANKKTALLTTFLLAISPWHIQFSRIAFESNVGLAFNVFAALFFIKSFKKPWLLPFATCCMGLDLSIYQSDKVFTPLLALLLVSVFWKQLFSLPKKYLIAAFMVGFLTAFPMVYGTLTNKESLARAQGVSIISQQSADVELQSQRLLRDKEHQDYIGYIIDNRRIVYVKDVIAGYLSHFDVNWLFTRGDIARHHAPDMGLLYLWEIPFLFIGIYLLIFGNFPKKTKLLIFGWFLLAPVPASVTTGVPHAVRTLNFLPTFQIFSAIGLIGSYLFIKRMFIQQVRYAIVILGCLFFTFNVLYYLDQYFVQLNYATSLDWQYGWKEAINEVKSIEKNYDKIVVTNKAPLDQSYMFFLFYLHYPPADYQKYAKNASGGFRENHRFGKYEFRPIDWSKEEKNSRTLFIGKPDEFPVGVKMVKPIFYLNKEPAIYIVEG